MEALGSPKAAFSPTDKEPPIDPEPETLRVDNKEWPDTCNPEDGI